MKSVKISALILCALTLPLGAYAESSEETRLKGFAEHQKGLRQFDQARSRGARSHWEELEQWELVRERSLDEYKKQSKSQEMTDEGVEAQADLKQKKAWDQAREEEGEKFLQARKDNAVDRVAKGYPSEATELGLDGLRPRYDYRKRAAFGAPKTKFGVSSGSRSGSPSGGGSSWGGGGGGGNSFPTPPPFDDFNNDGGFIPAPNMPDDFGDIPPPPPPPVFDSEGVDINNGTMPMPPPTFDDGGEF